MRCRRSPPSRTRRSPSPGWTLPFLHRAAVPADVTPPLPPGTALDTYNGLTYISLVAFRMHRTGLSRTPGLPHLGTSPDTTVRPHPVDRHGRCGVASRSPEASRLLPAAAGLPSPTGPPAHRPTGPPAHRPTGECAALPRRPGPVRPPIHPERA
ncbi:DUF2071 domain-containing protein [Kitasatospora sp. NPDC092948]|uniref:DUF2071 domain-containing protein n=1 Tax=Kitasatospora sp. NPDC092948 TaxID=3364088 RepID=UPI00380DD895